MPEKQFWARAPIYIVICVLLGFVIAGLLAQNIQLKNDLAEVKTEQREQQAKTEDVQRQADRIIAYLRCISLTPVGERTPELIDKCLTEDLPPQLSTGTETGGTSFLAPAPDNGARQQPTPLVDNSPGNSGQTPANPGPQNPQPQGILPTLTSPLCANITPRACATLGL